MRKVGGTLLLMCLGACGTPQQNAATLSGLIKVVNGICQVVPLAGTVATDVVNPAASAAPKGGR